MSVGEDFEAFVRTGGDVTELDGCGWVFEDVLDYGVGWHGLSYHFVSVVEMRWWVVLDVPWMIVR